eukprot:3454975-Amphidinium_carterae.1
MSLFRIPRAEGCQHQHFGSTSVKFSIIKPCMHLSAVSGPSSCSALAVPAQARDVMQKRLLVVRNNLSNVDEA